MVMEEFAVHESSSPLPLPPPSSSPVGSDGTAAPAASAVRRGGSGAPSGVVCHRSSPLPPPSSPVGSEGTAASAALRGGSGAPSCVVCHRSISVTAADLVRLHGPVRSRCPGSRKPPLSQVSSNIFLSRPYVVPMRETPLKIR